MSEKRSKRESKNMVDSPGWTENGVNGAGILSHVEQVNGVLFAIVNAVNDAVWNFK